MCVCLLVCRQMSSQEVKESIEGEGWEVRCHLPEGRKSPRWAGPGRLSVSHEFLRGDGG